MSCPLMILLLVIYTNVMCSPHLCQKCIWAIPCYCLSAVHLSVYYKVVNNSVNTLHQAVYCSCGVVYCSQQVLRHCRLQFVTCFTCSCGVVYCSQQVLRHCRLQFVTCFTCFAGFLALPYNRLCQMVGCQESYRCACVYSGCNTSSNFSYNFVLMYCTHLIISVSFSPSLPVLHIAIYVQDFVCFTLQRN